MAKILRQDKCNTFYCCMYFILVVLATNYICTTLGRYESSRCFFEGIVQKYKCGGFKEDVLSVFGWMGKKSQRVDSIWDDDEGIRIFSTTDDYCIDNEGSDIGTPILTPRTPFPVSRASRNNTDHILEPSSDDISEIQETCSAIKEDCSCVEKELESVCQKHSGNDYTDTDKCENVDCRCADSSVDSSHQSDDDSEEKHVSKKYVNNQGDCNREESVLEVSYAPRNDTSVHDYIQDNSYVSEDRTVVEIGLEPFRRCCRLASLATNDHKTLVSKNITETTTNGLKLNTKKIDLKSSFQKWNKPKGLNKFGCISCKSNLLSATEDYSDKPFYEVYTAYPRTEAPFDTINPNNFENITYLKSLLQVNPPKQGILKDYVKPTCRQVKGAIKSFGKTAFSCKQKIKSVPLEITKPMDQNDLNLLVLEDDSLAPKPKQSTNKSKIIRKMVKPKVRLVKNGLKNVGSFAHSCKKVYRSSKAARVDPNKVNLLSIGQTEMPVLGPKCEILRKNVIRPFGKFVKRMIEKATQNREYNDDVIRFVPLPPKRNLLSTNAFQDEFSAEQAKQKYQAVTQLLKKITPKQNSTEFFEANMSEVNPDDTNLLAQSLYDSPYLDSSFKYKGTCADKVPHDLTLLQGMVKPKCNMLRQIFHRFGSRPQTRYEIINNSPFMKPCVPNCSPNMGGGGGFRNIYQPIYGGGNPMCDPMARRPSYPNMYNPNCDQNRYGQYGQFGSNMMMNPYGSYYPNQQNCLQNRPNQFLPTIYSPQNCLPCDNRNMNYPVRNFLGKYLVSKKDSKNDYSLLPNRIKSIQLYDPEYDRGTTGQDYRYIQQPYDPYNNQMKPPNPSGPDFKSPNLRGKLLAVPLSEKDAFLFSTTQNIIKEPSKELDLDCGIFRKSVDTSLKKKNDDASEKFQNVCDSCVNKMAEASKPTQKAQDDDQKGQDNNNNLGQHKNFNAFVQDSNVYSPNTCEQKGDMQRPNQLPYRQYKGQFMQQPINQPQFMPNMQQQNPGIQNEGQFVENYIPPPCIPNQQYNPNNQFGQYPQMQVGVPRQPIAVNNMPNGYIQTQPLTQQNQQFSQMHYQNRYPQNPPVVHLLPPRAHYPEEYVQDESEYLPEPKKCKPSRKRAKKKPVYYEPDDDEYDDDDDDDDCDNDEDVIEIPSTDPSKVCEPCGHRPLEILEECSEYDEDGDDGQLYSRRCAGGPIIIKSVPIEVAPLNVCPKYRRPPYQSEPCPGIFCFRQGVTHEIKEECGCGGPNYKTLVGHCQDMNALSKNGTNDILKTILNVVEPPQKNETSIDSNLDSVNGLKGNKKNLLNIDLISCESDAEKIRKLNQLQCQLRNIQESNRKLQEANCKLQSCNKNFQEANKALQCRVADLEKCNKNLECALEKLRKCNKELECRNKKFQTCIEKLKCENKELKCANEKARMCNQNNQSRLQKLGAQLEELLKCNKALECANKKFKNCNDELEARNKKLQCRVSEFQTKIQELQKCNKALECAMKKLEDCAHKKDLKNMELQKCNDEMRCAIKKLQCSNKEANAKNKELECRLVEMNKRIKELEKCNKALECINKKLENCYKKLECRKNNLEKCNKGLKESLCKLQNCKTALTKRVEQLCAQNKQLQQCNKELECANAKMKKRNCALENLIKAQEECRRKAQCAMNKGTMCSVGCAINRLKRKFLKPKKVAKPKKKKDPDYLPCYDDMFKKKPKKKKAKKAKKLCGGNCHMDKFKTYLTKKEENCEEPKEKVLNFPNMPTLKIVEKDEDNKQLRTIYIETGDAPPEKCTEKDETENKKNSNLCSAVCTFQKLLDEKTIERMKHCSSNDNVISDKTNKTNNLCSNYEGDLVKLPFLKNSLKNNQLKPEVKPTIKNVNNENGNKKFSKFYSIFTFKKSNETPTRPTTNTENIKGNTVVQSDTLRRCIATKDSNKQIDSTVSGVNPTEMPTFKKNLQSILSCNDTVCGNKPTQYGVPLDTNYGLESEYGSDYGLDLDLGLETAYGAESIHGAESAYGAEPYGPGRFRRRPRRARGRLGSRRSRMPLYEQDEEMFDARGRRGEESFGPRPYRGKRKFGSKIDDECGVAVCKSSILQPKECIGARRPREGRFGGRRPGGRYGDEPDDEEAYDDEPPRRGEVHGSESYGAEGYGAAPRAVGGYGAEPYSAGAYGAESPAASPYGPAPYRSEVPRAQEYGPQPYAAGAYKAEGPTVDPYRRDPYGPGAHEAEGPTADPYRRDPYGPDAPGAPGFPGAPGVPGMPGGPGIPGAVEYGAEAYGPEPYAAAAQSGVYGPAPYGAKQFPMGPYGIRQDGDDEDDDEDDDDEPPEPPGALEVDEEFRTVPCGTKQREKEAAEQRMLEEELGYDPGAYGYESEALGTGKYLISPREEIAYGEEGEHEGPVGEYEGPVGEDEGPVGEYRKPGAYSARRAYGRRRAHGRRGRYGRRGDDDNSIPGVRRGRGQRSRYRSKARRARGRKGRFEKGGSRRTRPFELKNKIEAVYDDDCGKSILDAHCCKTDDNVSQKCISLYNEIKSRLLQKKLGFQRVACPIRDSPEEKKFYKNIDKVTSSGKMPSTDPNKKDDEKVNDKIKIADNSIKMDKMVGKLCSLPTIFSKISNFFDCAANTTNIDEAENYMDDLDDESGAQRKDENDMDLLKIAKIAPYEIFPSKPMETREEYEKKEDVSKKLQEIFKQGGVKKLRQEDIWREADELEGDELVLKGIEKGMEGLIRKDKTEEIKKEEVKKDEVKEDEVKKDEVKKGEDKKGKIESEKIVRDEDEKEEVEKEVRNEVQIEKKKDTEEKIDVGKTITVIDELNEVKQKETIEEKIVEKKGGSDLEELKDEPCEDEIQEESREETQEDIEDETDEEADEENMGGESTAKDSTDVKKEEKYDEINKKNEETSQKNSNAVNMKEGNKNKLEINANRRNSLCSLQHLNLPVCTCKLLNITKPLWDQQFVWIGNHKGKVIKIEKPLRDDRPVRILVEKDRDTTNFSEELNDQYSNIIRLQKKSSCASHMSNPCPTPTFKEPLGSPSLCGFNDHYKIVNYDINGNHIQQASIYPKFNELNDNYVIVKLQKKGFDTSPINNYKIYKISEVPFDAEFLNFNHTNPFIYLQEPRKEPFKCDSKTYQNFPKIINNYSPTVDYLNEYYNKETIANSDSQKNKYKPNYLSLTTSPIKSILNSSVKSIVPFVTKMAGIHKKVCNNVLKIQ